MFLKLIVLLTNREITDLLGEAWPQTERLFESVNQSSITLLRWSAKRLIFQFLCQKIDLLNDRSPLQPVAGQGCTMNY